KENIISAIEIAAAVDADRHPKVPQVCIFFENQLLQGNRSKKYNAENFKAFISANYPVLADVGIHIKFNDNAIHHPKKWGKPLVVNDRLSTDVAVLKLFPGISREYVDAVIGTANLRALILETFGSGNAPTSEWFIKTVKECTDRGIIVLNVTQCNTGSVDMNSYANGMALKEVGVISGYDITIESAITKLYVLLGKYKDNREVKREFEENISGEFSKNN
ncbi:MAG: asparaginase, partial [Bacteroidales bacterium]|nr:asparaginase [Bacteroidales bacterium]